MSRFLMLFTATVTGTCALLSWVFGELTTAGVLGAISAACVLVAEGIGYCGQRRDERARRTRAEVWERRLGEVQHNNPHCTVIRGGREPVWLEHDRLWQPCFDHDHGHRAVWPHDVGGFE